ncbi:MAG: hypothetical protein DRO87_08405 [Candidatus Thorarchaeota archaeon]|nr:MAG: hypothetical protein DRP09_14710 [Candidatus Thorarchaeota archaeon]RLI56014.1 MAG: hypothetical protein DRO87_08405 [Candidatus Thorarchaeota archaeon]
MADLTSIIERGARSVVNSVEGLQQIFRTLTRAPIMHGANDNIERSYSQEIAPLHVVNRSWKEN